MSYLNNWIVCSVIVSNCMCLCKCVNVCTSNVSIKNKSHVRQIMINLMYIYISENDRNSNNWGDYAVVTNLQCQLRVSSFYSHFVKICTVLTMKSNNTSQQRQYESVRGVTSYIYIGQLEDLCCVACSQNKGRWTNTLSLRYPLTNTSV